MLACRARQVFAPYRVPTPIESQLSEVLDQLIPNQAFAAVVRVGAASIRADTRDQMIVGDWALARQQEYLAGRWCAREAMAQAGLVDGAALRADPDGLPQWPKGVLGSITHSKGLCAAAVGAEGELVLLGLDLERTDRIGTAAMKRVIHSAESGFAGESQINASILFSLKEAFYKAQYPKWRTSGNFHDLALDVNLEQGSAEVREISPQFAADLVRSASELRFRFGLFGDYVVSLCWLPR